MTVIIKLSSKQRAILITLAAGESVNRRAPVLWRLLAMGLIEYVPGNPPGAGIPRITDAGLNAINDGPEILGEMIECRTA